MHYTLTVRHINEDFSIPSSTDTTEWQTSFEDNADLILFLNRVAIATSQSAPVDFPEIEIFVDQSFNRFLVKAIQGQLYFTDPHSQNRRDLKVIPEEAIRLLAGKPLEEVFLHEGEDLGYTPIPQKKSRWPVFLLRQAIVLISIIVVVLSLRYTINEVQERESLIEVPRFVQDLESEGPLLRAYADVYVSEYREGATVFELERDGTFTLYELWFSQGQNGFVLVPVASHEVSAGLHNGRPAFLAGQYHLLKLKDESIELHDVNYRRHGKKLSTIGEVLE